MASLSCFAPHVQEQLQEILRRGRIGLTPGAVKVTNWMPSCPPYTENAKCDRFKVTVPYGGNCIAWDVVFYSRHPEAAPDLVFTEDTFPIDLEGIYDLCYWNHENSSGLLTVIKQVLDIYRKHHVEKVSEHMRVNFEYSTLLQQEGFQEQDIEVFVSPKVRGPITFLIRLPVDFGKLPPMMTPHNPDEDCALLMIIFQTPEGNRVTPQLFLSPGVEHALGGAQQWRIPTFPSDGCLMDYVPCIIDLLQKRTVQVASAYQKRKEYISLFLSHFEGSILEYDAESFTQLSLLFECDDFCFVLRLSLDISFPSSEPSLTFQSIYHETANKPFSIIVECPYDVTWSPQEVVSQMESFVVDYVPVFQNAYRKK